MPNWIQQEKQLIKEFSFKNFVEAINFVNQVGVLAEKNNHHPDIFIYNYKNVRLSLRTHSEDKVTDKDYKLAEEIDKI